MYQILSKKALKSYIRKKRKGGGLFHYIVIDVEAVHGKKANYLTAKGYSRMIFQKKRNTKKRFKKSAVISLFTLCAFLLTFFFSFNSTFAQQDVNEPNQKPKESGSQKNYQIIVKLSNETAAMAEAQLTQKDMVISKSSSKNLGDLFSKYKIKKMEPMYKGLVNWKKKNGKTEKEYYNKIQKNFQKRTKRSKKDVSANTNLSSTYVIEADVSSQEEYEKLLESLKKDPRFEYAEANMEVSTCTVPDDPYFSSSGSWGQTYDDLYGVKLTSCPEAWNTATGEGVTVAVVDTGIDNTHPDIVNNMWTNTKEIANNGIDDDNNGYIDDIWGWDFTSSDNNPVDDNGHGTHVAGTIAATGNNGIGIVGVAPGAKVMAVKGLYSSGGGNPDILANAIVYAVENGADIINCSFGGKGYSQAFEDAVNTAVNLGAVVVVAAGNDDNDVSEYSPASIKDAITVAATDNSDKKAYFSNWGSGIDMAAPGVDILSLLASDTTKGSTVGSKYTRLNGTSMAAPHVAGVAALILSNQRELSNEQVYFALKNSSDDIITTGFDYFSGYGRVNAGRALQIHNSVEAYIESPVQGSNINSNISVTGCARGDNFSSYTLEYGKIISFGQEPVEWSTIGQGNYPIDGGKLGDFNTSDYVDGKYVIRLTVKDNSTPQKKYIDRVEVEVDKIGFTYPQTAMDPSYATGIKLGKVITIQGRAIDSTFKNYYIEWGAGLNPTEWHTTGFTLENGGSTPVSGGTLAKWDSGVCPGSAGYYQLRLVVENEGFTNEDRTIIYLEPDLASENWPQKLESPLADKTSVLPSRNSTGQSSLVGISSLQKEQTSLVRYSHDGALQYKLPFNNVADSQVAVGDIDDSPGEEVVFVKDDMLRILRMDNSYTEFPLNEKYNFRKNPVILQDLDGDSVPEILTIGSDVISLTRCLYAYKLDGSIFSSKFPLVVHDISRSFESNMRVNFLILDINNDGENEIITQQTDDNFTTTLNLYKWDGTPLVWQAEQPSFTDAFIKNMMGGDLDHDGQGEIVIWAGGLRADSIQQLYVINSDGSVKSGWPYTLRGGGIDLAIADMDRDGTDEIVYSELNEINVLKTDGRPMSSAWPDYRTRYYGNFSIGDINSDSYPEIIAYHMEEYTYTSFDSSKRKYVENEVVAIDRNAQVIKSWKVKGPGGAKSDKELVYSAYKDLEPALGDFNNDGKVDIAINLKLFDGNNNLVDGALTVLTTDGDYNPENMDWPVILHNPQNTSVNIAAKTLPVVTDIALNTTSASISVGGKTRLTATVLPAGANRNILWSVNSESTNGVAIVAQDGIVTAKLPGTAVIRATSLADSSKYAECIVSVTEALEGVLFMDDFEVSSGSVIDGWKVQKVSGDKGEWSIVSNSTNPIVNNPKSGTKMAKFNSYDVKSTMTRLYRNEGINLEDESYCLDFWMYHDPMGDSGSGISSIQVQVSTDGGVNWINVGNQINRYDGSRGWKEHTIKLDQYAGASGLQIAFLGTGNSGGNIYLDDVSVVKSVPVAEVSLNKTTMTLEAGKSEQLIATITPANAINKEVIWTIQKESTSYMATVSSTGRVVANNVGTAVIRATSAADPSKYAECTVTVTPAVIPVTGINLNKTAMTLEEGQNEQLIATITPSNATNKEVIWTVQSQSTSNVATVSSTGLVTGNNAGTAVIRATSAVDSSKYMECTLIVKSAEMPVASTLLSEGFEGTDGSIPAGWATNNTDGLWSVVSSGTNPNPGTPKAGSRMLKFNSYDAPNNASTRLYRTSGITLGITDSYKLEFWMYHDAGNSNYEDSIQVQVTKGNGDRWINVGSAIKQNDGSTGWKLHTVDLNEYKNVGDLRIAFLAFSGHGNNIYLDDIAVIGTSTKVIGISLNKASTTLEVGQTEQLTATVAPDNAINKNVVWMVQGTDSTVTVSSSGLVTAKNPGTAVVRVASVEDYGKYAECTVTVKSVEVPVVGTLLSEGFEGPTGSIPAGWAKTENVYAKWSVVSNGTNPDPGAPKSGTMMAKFNSFDARMNTVSRLYTTSGLDLGSTGDYRLEFWMYHDTENPDYGDRIRVEVSTDGGSSWRGVGSTIYRSDGSTGWKLHTVDLNQFRNTGDLRIGFSAYSGNGNNMYLDDVSVVRSVPVAEVSLNKTTMTLEAGHSEQLTATITPENTTNKEVIWTVQSQSTSNVVIVSSTGLVTGNNAGTAVVRATSAADPGKYAECTVNVKPAVIPVAGISLNKTKMTLESGQSEQLTANIIPANATNKEVIWTVQSHSTSNVSTVSSTGLVTGTNVGTAVIRVTSAADPSKYAECTVTVKPTVIPVTGISLNKTTMSLEAGQNEQLTTTITPENATNKEVIWTVQSQSASNVATVSSSGLVTGNNVGTVVIRATSTADPNKFSECTVTVEAVEIPVDGVLLSEGFEDTDGSIPAGWEKTVNALAIWSVVSSGTNPDPGAPKSGSVMAKFNSYNAPGNTSARLYTTSGLNLANTGNYRLEFWMYHDTGNPNHTDGIQTQVSTNGGSSWISVGSTIKRSDGSTGWKLHTVDLNQFRNTSDLRIAFLALSGNGNNMYLDDISVTCTSTDITEDSLYKGLDTQDEEQDGQMTKPAVAEPEITEPTVTEPAVAEPRVTEPASTEPVVTEPAIPEPGVTEPGVPEPDTATDENAVLTVQDMVSTVRNRQW